MRMSGWGMLRIQKIQDTDLIPRNNYLVVGVVDRWLQRDAHRTAST